MKLGSHVLRVILGGEDTKSPAHGLRSRHVPVSVTLRNWLGLAWSQGESASPNPNALPADVRVLLGWPQPF